MSGQICLPLAWGLKAAKCRGRAFLLGTVLWHLSRRHRNRMVRPEGPWLEAFGIDRQTLYRSLRALESAGLVEVSRQQGRRARVTLIEPPQQQEELAQWLTLSTN